MSAPTIDVPTPTHAPAVDDQVFASLEAAFFAPEIAQTDAPEIDSTNPRASYGVGELFVLASFASLTIGFLVLIGIQLF